MSSEASFEGQGLCIQSAARLLPMQACILDVHAAVQPYIDLAWMLSATVQAPASVSMKQSGLLCRRWVGAIGYAVCGAVGCVVIPHLYPACKWYMVAVVFLSSPVFSVGLPSPCSTLVSSLLPLHAPLHLIASELGCVCMHAIQ